VQDAKEGTARIALWREINSPNIFTLESSFCGSTQNNFHFSTRDLEEMGQKILQAVYIKWNIASVVLVKAPVAAANTAATGEGSLA
jgi:hypothetical protein